MTENTPQPEFIKPDTKARLEDVPITNDIVGYTMACILALAPRTSMAVVTAVERQVRDVFGGDEVRIAEGAAQLRRERDAKIKRDYIAGERMELLERRYEISRRRLFQIIKS